MVRVRSGRRVGAQSGISASYSASIKTRSRRNPDRSYVSSSLAVNRSPELAVLAVGVRSPPTKRPAPNAADNSWTFAVPPVVVSVAELC